MFKISHHNAHVIVVGYFLLEFLILIFTKNCHIPQLFVIFVDFISFKLSDVRGVRLLETKFVNFARGVRLLESVRLLETIRYYHWQLYIYLFRYGDTITIVSCPSKKIDSYGTCSGSAYVELNDIY